MPQALGVEKSNLISIAGLSLGHHPVLELPGVVENKLSWTLIIFEVSYGLTLCNVCVFWN